MRKWTVYLPNNKRFELESDDPHAALRSMGFTEYGLWEETQPTASTEPPSTAQEGHKDPLQDPAYRIPQETLTDTIESLRELVLRLEIEASVYQQMNTHQGILIADDRLEQAARVKRCYEHFLNL